jgi:hypothetical protein
MEQAIRDPGPEEGLNERTGIDGLAAVARAIIER